MVRALIVTPTYRGTSIQLNATHRDGQAWREFLLARGVKAENIVWLAEETIPNVAGLPNVAGVPSLENIFREMANLVQSSSDYLVFFYAGHGTQVSDGGGEEEDGLDECIVTTDVKYIKDDVLKQRLVDTLRPSQKLLCVFDCCHSQTMLDLVTTVDFEPKNNSLVLRAVNQVLEFAA
jgi:hypothetical protein